MNIKQILGLVGSVLMIIASFLPVVAIEFNQTTSVFQAGIAGKVVLLLGILALVFTLMKKHKLVLIISGIGGILFWGIIYFVVVGHITKGIGTGVDAGTLRSAGLGVWLGLVASVLLVLSGLMKGGASAGTPSATPKA